ncbi:hypothetical protein [Calothrix sp. PCC 6303]
MFLFWRLLKRTAKNACLAAKMDAKFSNQKVILDGRHYAIVQSKP